ncbi:MAG: sulfotransferase family protein [Candidatus Entotheonellia bacterium]
MRLPNFLIVGAPRTGTTSMHRYLSEHPEIFLAAKKELHYFTHDYLTENSNGPKDREYQYCKTLDEYRAFFQAVPSNAKAVGEISPSYLFFPQCIPKIKALLGESVRIIIMLRNPIERAFSNYWHMVNSKRETLPFWDALQAEEERLERGWRNIWLYKRHSLYHEKVRRYIEEFGSSRVKVLLYDDFSNNTLRTLRDAQRFLGVRAEFAPKNIDVVFGGRGVERRKSVARRRIKSLVKLLLPQRVFGVLRKLEEAGAGGNAKSEARPDDQCVAFLRQYFSEDINRLERLLQTNLSMWK